MFLKFQRSRRGALCRKMFLRYAFVHCDEDKSLTPFTKQIGSRGNYNSIWIDHNGYLLADSRGKNGRLTCAWTTEGTPRGWLRRARYAVGDGLPPQMAEGGLYAVFFGDGTIARIKVLCETATGFRIECRYPCKATGKDKFPAQNCGETPRPATQEMADLLTGMKHFVYSDPHIID